MYIYPFNEHYLSGYSQQLSPAAVDTAYYNAELPENIEYSVDGTESEVSPDGVLTAKGDGEFNVSVKSGEIEGSAKYTVYKTPTNIIFVATAKKEQ